MAKTNVQKLNKSWLDDVPADKVFWCHDGKIIRNMTELALALQEMSIECYMYHANDVKNDFSTWVQEVIGDITLARQLSKASQKDAATRNVDSRLKTLRRK